MTRKEALDLYRRYIASESLYRHALSVEAVMRRFAEELGHDPDYWGIVGILHAIDYELYPGEHLRKDSAMLREDGVSESHPRRRVMMDICCTM